MTVKERSSNFELLRILLICFIVTYHFFVIVYVHETSESDPLLKAIWLPLHIAVICFVLISGYFHIRPSLKGGLKLLLPVIVYYSLPCIIANLCGLKGMDGSLLSYLLFFSKSPYWFIRTYFYLFLLSPVLNKWLDCGSFKSKAYILIVLFFIGVYEALMGDLSVSNGKNVVLFMFLYVLGDLLREKQLFLERISISILSVLWIVFNLLLVFVWMHFRDSALGNLLWRLSFPYSSPILIINAVWLFVIFSKVKLQSGIINYFARSVFAVYILTESDLIKPLLLQPSLKYIYEINTNSFILVLGVVLFAITVTFVCLLIDKIFQPLLHIILQKVEKIAI